MSAPAIDLLRRTHALLEEAIRRMDAFETDSARDDSDAATVSESLRTAIDTLESIAGRVLMRTPVEPPRLSAECADEEPESPMAAMARALKAKADAEDRAEAARTEALLPPAETTPGGRFSSAFSEAYKAANPASAETGAVEFAGLRDSAETLPRCPACRGLVVSVDGLCDCEVTP